MSEIIKSVNPAFVQFLGLEISKPKFLLISLVSGIALIASAGFKLHKENPDDYFTQWHR